MCTGERELYQSIIEISLIASYLLGSSLKIIIKTFAHFCPANSNSVITVYLAV